MIEEEGSLRERDERSKAKPRELLSSRLVAEMEAGGNWLQREMEGKGRKRKSSPGSLKKEVKQSSVWENEFFSS